VLSSFSCSTRNVRSVASKDDSVTNSIRICHVINGTSPGGAERMLQRLVTRTQSDDFNHQVIALNHFGVVAEELTESGINVESLEMHERPARLPLTTWRLRQRLKQLQPDIVLTWLYVSDVVGTVATKLSVPSAKIVWNVRHSTLDPAIDSRSLRLAARVAGHLSKWAPSRIVMNSFAAIPAHCAVGYAREQIEVIPNGFDTELFRPNPIERQRVRAEFGLSDATPLIGLLGRYHPHKDHHTFLRAARIVADARPDARFLLCGMPSPISTEEMSGLVAELGLTDRVLLSKARSDMAAVNAALDVSACSSLTESFPNAVGEAMSCCVPCVSTFVGDAALLIGDTGRIVPPSDSVAFANGLLSLLTLSPADRQQLGQQARERIIERYSMNSVVERFVSMWCELTNREIPIAMPGEVERAAA